MADNSAAQPSPDSPAARAHECIKVMARCAWGTIDMAHGGEAPMSKVNPFREFYHDGKWKPIPRQTLSNDPAALAGAVVAIKHTIGEYQEISSDAGGSVQLSLSPDGSSLSEGAGGKFSHNWHDVAVQLFDGVFNLISHVVDLSKIVVVLPRVVRENQIPLLAQECNANTSVLSAEQVDRLYGAIRRTFTTFNIDQLTARLDDEYNRAKPPDEADVIWLTDREQTIWEALGNEELTAEQLAKKAGYKCNSAFRATLSAMKKREILIAGANNRRYRRGNLIPHERQ